MDTLNGAILGIVGCIGIAGTAQAYDDNQARSNARIMSQAASYVAAMLKDPGSAKFTNMYIVREPQASKDAPEVVSVCGIVSARNGVGEENESVRFVAYHMNGKIAGDTFHAVVDDPSDATATFDGIHWNGTCGHPGRQAMPTPPPPLALNILY